MKITYLLLHIHLNETGAQKKVVEQINCWQNENHQVDLIIICPKGFQLLTKQITPHYIYYNSYFDFYKVYWSAFRILKKINPQLIYSRNNFYLPGLLKIFKEFPAVIEINSHEIAEWHLKKANSFIGFIKYYYYRLSNLILFRKIKAFVCVTNEIGNTIEVKKFNKPVAVIPNGTDIFKFNQRKTAKFDRKIPELVFIGTPGQKWHGIDKIFEIAKKTVGLLNFNLIGIDQKSDLPANVKCYGYLAEKDYMELMLNCDIGIGTLSLSKKEMIEACPIKVRLYLALGLPIIIGYIDSAFISKKPDWLLYINENKEVSETQIKQIVSFSYDKKNVIVPINDLINTIHLSHLEKDRLHFFEELIK